MQLYWLEQTQSEVPEGNAWLSAAENSHQESLRFAKRRNDWRLGRWTAKLAVAAHHRGPSEHSQLALIEVRPEPSGAPEVFVTNRPAGAAISLSHCDGRAICMVGAPSAAMGCDLEAIEDRGDAFFADYFTDSEQSWIGAAPEPEHPRLTTLVWSAKESVLKALRVGLRSPTRSVIVSPVDVSLAVGAGDVSDAWFPLRVETQEARVFQGWWRRTDHFIYTVVSDPSAPPPIRLEVAGSTDLPSLTTI